MEIRRHLLMIATIAVALIAASAVRTTVATGLATPTTTTSTATSTTQPTIPPVIVQPTTTRPSTTLPPVVVQPTTTRPTTTITPTPPVATTTPPPAAAPATGTDAVPTSAPVATPDVFVRTIVVTQGDQDLQPGLPLVAGRRTTVQVHVGVDGLDGSDGGTVDGALLVQRQGRPAEVLVPQDHPIDVRADDGAFAVELESHHYAAGEVTFTAAVWLTTGELAVVDDSVSENNTMTTSVEFHAGRNPTLWLVVSPELADPAAPLDVAGDIREVILDPLPAADLDVRLVPWPVSPDTRADQQDPPAWKNFISQLIWAGVGDVDRVVIVGSLWNPAANAGHEEEIEIHSVSWGTAAPSLEPYDYPGEYAGRFDGVDYCQSLDSLGIPCDPVEIGLVAETPAAGCETESVEWAGLQLDLCLGEDPSSTAPAEAEIEDKVTFSYQSIKLRAAHDGWSLVSGSLDTVNRSASIDGAAMSGALTPAVAGRVAAAIEGTVNGTTPADTALQLVSPDGTPLVVVPLNAEYHQVTLERVTISHDDVTGDDADPMSVPAFDFVAPIPWVDGAAAIEVVSLTDGAVIASGPIEPTVPQVGSAQTETIGSARTVNVSWEVDDPAGAGASDTTFDVLWSNDGETWLPAAVGLTGKDVALKNTSYFPAGDRVQIQVLAREGLGTNSATSEPISFPTSGPVVAIAGEPDGPIGQSERIELAAIVFDAEDSAAGDEASDGAGNVVWRDSLGGRLFDGRLLSARDLQVGTHAIEVTVTDSDGNEATAEVVIEIVEANEAEPSAAMPAAAAVELLTADSVTVTTAAQAALPGGQSCGSNECVALTSSMHARSREDSPSTLVPSHPVRTASRSSVSRSRPSPTDRSTFDRAGQGSHGLVPTPRLRPGPRTARDARAGSRRCR